jgi:hypothetical protein
VIFWQCFMAALGIFLALAIAVSAVIGFIVIGIIGKQAYDERQRTVWLNEPPTSRGPRS